MTLGRFDSRPGHPDVAALLALLHGMNADGA